MMDKLISILVMAMTLSSCAVFRPTPGKEKEAEPGFRASQPVIQALANFRDRQDKYPSKLADLVPDYLNSIDEQLFYQLDSGSYVLGFTYTGWGISYCEFRPEKNWNCKTKY